MFFGPFRSYLVLVRDLAKTCVALATSFVQVATCTRYSQKCKDPVLGPSRKEKGICSPSLQAVVLLEARQIASISFLRSSWLALFPKVLYRKWRHEVPNFPQNPCHLFVNVGCVCVDKPRWGIHIQSFVDERKTRTAWKVRIPQCTVNETSLDTNINNKKSNLVANIHNSTGNSSFRSTFSRLCTPSEKTGKDFLYRYKGKSLES